MTDEELIRQVYQALFGVNGTDEKGIAGDIKNIKDTLKNVCNDQNKLEEKVNNLIWYLIGTGILTAGAGAGILKLALG